MKRLLAAVICLATLAGCTVGTIETGNVGVVKRWGKVNMTPIGEGFYFNFFTSVEEATTKEVSVELNDMTPKAHDNLFLKDFDATVYYETTGSQIPTFLTKKEGQSAWHENKWYPGYKLISNLARGAAYDEVQKYDSLVIHTKRPQVEDGIKRAVQTDLDADPVTKGMFRVTRVVVRSVVTDPSIEAAIQKNVNKEKDLDSARKDVEIARQEGLRMEQLTKNGGPAFTALLNAQANMKVAEGIAAGKVSTIIVPGNFTALGNFAR